MSNLNNNDKIVVLHIASTGRSGSTLLERVLNEFPGFFAAGELAWVDLFTKEKACFCGSKFDDCPVWGKVRRNSVFKRINEESFVRESIKYRRIIEFLKLWGLLKIRRMPDDFKQYLESLQILYRTIQNESNCQVIIDSSASFIYGYYLSLIPSIELYVLHLVRHPNGFAYSQRRVKLTSKNVPWSKKIAFWQSAFIWLKKNLVIELFFLKSKYLRVYYEDFIENPAQIVKRIRKMLNYQLDEQFSFINGNKVKLGEQHITRGNLNSFNKQKEEITLELDECWKHNMRWWNIVFVILITWPLLLKYFIDDKMMKKKRF